MVSSSFTPARLLDDAGVAIPRLMSVSERRGHALSRLGLFGSAREATIRLVGMVLQADDDPDAYRRILWQLDAAQHEVDQLPPNAAETDYLENILDAVPLSGEPVSVLREHLLAYEAFLQRDARLEDALTLLALGAHTYGHTVPAADFAERALRAGRLNRLLARWDHATLCYMAAADAGRVANSEALLLLSRLGRGTVYRAQGELTAARAIAESVMREAARLGLADLQTAAYWDLGIVLRLEGLLAEALQAVYYAFQLSLEREARMRALSDVGVSLAAIGAFDESRCALETVLEGQKDVLLRTNALIGLMGVESAVGNRVAFERRRVETEDLRDRMPPAVAVDHRYRLGVGLARFGQPRRGRMVLDEALAIARANRLQGWCSHLERLAEAG